MNLIDIIVVLVLVLIFTLIIIYIISQRKKGVKCIGCPLAKTCKSRKCEKK